MKLLHLILLLIPLSFLGQSLPRYPTIIQVETRNSLGIAPLSFISDTSFIESYVYLRQFSGMFSDVRQSEIGVQIKGKMSKFGLYVHSDKEGEHLTTSRVQGKYSISVQVDKDIYLTAGLYAGLVNQSIGENTSLNSGTDIAPDLGIGFGFYTPTMFFKASISQVLNSDITPIYIPAELPQYYQLYGSKLFVVSDVWRVRMFAKADFYKDYKMGLNIGGSVIWREKLGIGAAATNNDGMIYFVEVNLLNSTSRVDLTTAYETQNAFAQNYISVPTYQFGITFRKKK